MNTVLCAVKELQKQGFKLTEHSIREGVANVCETTGLKGRWEVISNNPTIILDTGHNSGGLIYNMHQLKTEKAEHIRIILGMVSDKDIDSSLSLMPQTAIYYFTKATVKRALDEFSLQKKAQAKGLRGKCYPTVKQAYEAAISSASQNDIIYIGGSNFIVGDFLSFYKKEN